MLEESAVSDASTELFPDKGLKPFSTWRIPKFPAPGEALVAESEARLQNHLDVFGCMLFQSRDDILDTFLALAEDPAYRAKLGTLKAKEFDALSKLSEPDRALAMSVAELALNRLIDQVAGHLSVGARAYPGDFCVEYSIDSIVLKITGANANGVKLKKLAKIRISEQSSSKVAGCFGRWLNIFGRRD
jgi:hypothetical protein